jgi:hypothetical protein
MHDGKRPILYMVVTLLLLSLPLPLRQASGQTSLAPPPQRGTPELDFTPEDVQAVADRYQQELMQVPGVYSVDGAGDHILLGVLIHTDPHGEKPFTLPPPLQALPPTLEGVPVEILPLYILPPPAGVVVVQPFPPETTTESCPGDAVRGWLEDHFACYAVADVCPEGYREERNFDWRYCVNPDVFAAIPNLISPPVAGIPWAQVEATLARHQTELLQLPGVTSAGLGKEGIVVETANPTVVPRSIEGVPVSVHLPVPGQFLVGADLMGYEAARQHINEPLTPAE